MSVLQMSVANELAEPRLRQRRHWLVRWSRPALGLLLPLGLALGWEICVRAGLFSGRLVPPPSVIYATFAELARTGELQSHALTTLARVAAGFAIGVGVGTFLGAVTGYSALVRRVIDPSLQALRAIPSIAWVPLFILWLGIFEASKVTLIAVGAFFPVYLNLMTGLRQVDRKLVEVGHAYGYRGLALVARVLLPATLPAYVTGLRGGLGLGWMFVVAAEVMGASEGLGFLLVDGQMTGRPAVILGSIVLFAVLGKASDLALATIGQRFLAWQDVVRTNVADQRRLQAV